MPRKLTNWIDGFLQYTDGKGAPEIWRRWTALSILASAVERKVWIRTNKGQLFSNMYVLLVGGAGAGKSLNTTLATEFLGTLATDKKICLAPTSVTKASLIDALAGAERYVVNVKSTPPTVRFNSLSVVANEFGVFLPGYDSEFINAMTDLWDCKNYSETRRTNKLSINIPAAQVNLLSATTPSYLNNFLPEGAWDQGFMSRVICVYGSVTDYVDLFAIFEKDEELYNGLVSDLRSINEMFGQLSISDEVKEAINAWGKSGGAPAPTHPKLSHYNSRRAAHLLKLCMIATVAENNDLVVTLENYAEALDWLTEAETYMPDIFKAMKTGGDARVIEEAYHYLLEAYIKKKEPVQEHRLYHFLQERTPAHNVSRMIDVMEKAGMLKKQIVGSGYGYLPIQRAA